MNPALETAIAELLAVLERGLLVTPYIGGGFVIRALPERLPIKPVEDPDSTVRRSW